MISRMSLSVFTSGPTLSSSMRGSFWPFCVDSVRLSCLQRLSVASSLNICKVGLNFLYRDNREIEIFRTWPRAFVRLHLDGSRQWFANRCRLISPEYNAHLSAPGLAPSLRWIIDTGDRRLSPALLQWLRKISSGFLCVTRSRMRLLRTSARTAQYSNLFFRY